MVEENSAGPRRRHKMVQYAMDHSEESGNGIGAVDAVGPGLRASIRTHVVVTDVPDASMTTI